MIDVLTEWLREPFEVQVWHVVALVAIFIITLWALVADIDALRKRVNRG